MNATRLYMFAHSNGQHWNVHLNAFAFVNKRVYTVVKAIRLCRICFGAEIKSPWFELDKRTSAKKRNVAWQSRWWFFNETNGKTWSNNSTLHAQLLFGFNKTCTLLFMSDNKSCLSVFVQSYNLVSDKINMAEGRCQMSFSRPDSVCLRSWGIIPSLTDLCASRQFLEV